MAVLVGAVVAVSLVMGVRCGTHRQLNLWWRRNQLAYWVRARREVALELAEEKAPERQASLRELLLALDEDIADRCRRARHGRLQSAGQIPEQ